MKEKILKIQDNSILAFFQSEILFLFLYSLKFRQIFKSYFPEFESYQGNTENLIKLLNTGIGELKRDINLNKH